MVKATMTGRKQTTTQALGAGIARWIMQAGCGVMVLIGGELVACEIVQDEQTGTLLCLSIDDDTRYSLKCCRMHRETIAQIKSMIGLA